MQLPFFGKSQEEKNFFLSLLVKPYNISAILFEEINSKLFILGEHEISVDKPTSEATGEELVNYFDRVISAVEGSLPEGASVEKTIFSLPYSWVEEGKIKKDFLLILKKACEDLGLVPVGYLISIEAIIHYLEDQEGAPVSSIFIEVAKDEVEAYVVRAGKIIEVQSEKIEKGILKSVENLLKKVSSVDVLPSKIVLFHYRETEDIQQKFLSHTFPKDIPFLHVPQVVVLEKGVENQAIISGVAQQMELEVLPPQSPEGETSEPVSLAPLGRGSVRPKTPTETQGERLKKADAEDFGFVKEKDVAEDVPKKESTSMRAGVEEQETEKPPQEQEEEPSVTYYKEDETPSAPGPNVPTLLSAVPNPFLFLKKINVPNLLSHGPKLKLAALALSILVLLYVFSLLYYNFILSARVIISSDKQVIEKEAPVTFSTKGDTKDTIKITTVEREVSGAAKKESTGTKETGDLAKGEVTIYNKGEAKKTFPKGTVIVGPNNLEFKLQDDVTIASTSAFSTTLSSAKAKVEAAKFGQEYNLASSSNFTVKNLSSSEFIAKNESAITGGTKKEITVVSKDDLAELLATVTTDLEKQAASEVRKSLGDEEQILPAALSSSVTDRSYNRKEGEEAGDVTLNATIKYSFGKYSGDDIKKTITSLADTQVPEHYTLQEDESKVEIADIKVKKSVAAGTLKVKAVYTPVLSESDLARAARGKSIDAATSSLREIKGVNDVSIILSRELPILPKTLPKNAKNITIEIKY